MGLASLITPALAAVRAAVGDPVTYRRSSASVGLIAVTGSSQINYLTRDQTNTVIESRDFLVAAAELVLGGVQTLPEWGDTIEQVIDGKTYTHQVLDLGGEPSYRFTDPAKSQIRIHTKQIAVA